jgi:hypothetical protein
MKRHVSIILGATALGWLAGVTFDRTERAQASEPSGPRWEHKCKDVPFAGVTGTGTGPRAIEEAGSDGWELVSLAPMDRSGVTTSVVACYKRKRPE